MLSLLSRYAVASSLGKLTVGRCRLARRMATESFRVEQERGRYAPHVRAINEMVDGLQDQEGRGWLPHVAPWQGGVEARVLSVLRDPGPMVREGTGSGFLCIENDDPTAERQTEAFAAVGLTAQDMTPWNAYPWYINRAPNASELEAGVEPLVRLIALMPRLRVLLLQGAQARDSWRRVLKRYPGITDGERYTVVSTHHPGRQALWHRDPLVRAARQQHRDDACQRVADVLTG